MKIIKRTLLILSALFFCTSIYFIFIDNDINVSITEQQIDSAIQKKLPIKKNFPVKIPFFKDRKADIEIVYAKAHFHSAVDNPEGNGFVQVIGEINSDIDGSLATGDFDLFARIDYESGSFYLSDISFNSVNITNIKLNEKDQNTLDKSKAALAKAKKMKDNAIVIKNKLMGFLKKDKNEEIQPKEEKTPLLAVLKEKLIKKSKIFITEKIENIPVYTLKTSDYKQAIARMSLKEIFISDQEISANMDIGQFFETFYLYLFAIIFAIAFLFSGFLNGDRGRSSRGGLDVSDIADGFFSGFDF